MSEKGAPPKVGTTQRRILRFVSAFTSPLLPDDYLELINPLWSTRELRGKIERIEPETPDAATVVIRPGHEWLGHQPGQYLRIGLDIHGRRHWRAYSLTSDPGRPDGFISVTIKNVDEGVVSPFLVRRCHPGTLVSLGGVEGEFLIPDPVPQKLLFISAGSGITPIMSMLRNLSREDDLNDAVLLHSAPTADDVIFGCELRTLDSRHEGFSMHEQHTVEQGRMGPGDLDELCPDWREREAFLSGPKELLDAMQEHWEREGTVERFHLERFQPVIGEDVEDGVGGSISFLKSGIEAISDGGVPILVAGEEAGATLPYGCREGICHTCVGKLCSGAVRDLRTGRTHGQAGELVRTCVNAPEGPVEIEL